jgi:hypothetical protein
MSELELVVCPQSRRTRVGILGLSWRQCTSTLTLDREWREYAVDILLYLLHLHMNIIEPFSNLTFSLTLPLASIPSYRAQAHIDIIMLAPAKPEVLQIQHRAPEDQLHVSFFTVHFPLLGSLNYPNSPSIILTPVGPNNWRRPRRPWRRYIYPPLRPSCNSPRVRPRNRRSRRRDPMSPQQHPSSHLLGTREEILRASNPAQTV